MKNEQHLLEEALITALPYVEAGLDDEIYKDKNGVRKDIRKVRNALKILGVE